MSFPKDFVWGAATASYQIEGAAFEDGKGWSVWDMFCRKPGAVFNGHTGDVTCDHYHRYQEDVAMMKEIGLQGYRFSISWPRVIPNGTGKVNPKGLDFYSRLVDELLAAAVTPYVTLFHWDYPYELYCQGGWLNPESSNWFVDYTNVMVDALSDRVTHWITFNEPMCFVGLGHQHGVHAPGDQLGFKQVLRAAHNVLLSHGKAVQTIRSRTKSSCQIGFSPLARICLPASESPEDIEAARQNMFSVFDKTLWHNTWWMDPVYKGEYPEDGLRLFGEDAPEIASGDMDIICQPVDFLGFNHYRGEIVCAVENGETEILPFEDGHKQTAFFDRDGYWAVTPESLYWGSKFLWERYHLPLIITENGMSNIDWVSLDGNVHDPIRIDFLHRYLREFKKAARDGVDVRGYFLWSLMDNFEWAEAFRQRFGIVYVDYPTQKRTLKDSAYWYKEVIASHGEHL